MFLAPSNSHRIVLNFTFMDTECTYDYLFVYDGDSYQSPLLASLSGNTLPQPIEAKSGKVSHEDLVKQAISLIDGRYKMFVVFIFPFRCSFIFSAMPITTSWASMQLTPSLCALEPVAATVGVIPRHLNVTASMAGEGQLAQPHCAPSLVL